MSLKRRRDNRHGILYRKHGTGLLDRNRRSDTWSDIFIVGTLLSKEHRKIFAHIGKSFSSANFPNVFYTGELFSLCLSFLPAERKAVPICRLHDPSCAAPPFHLTVARRGPVFITAFSIVSVPFCFLLILEKRYHNSARTEVCSDHAAHRCVANLPQMPLPNVTAVLNVLQ